MIRGDDGLAPGSVPLNDDGALSPSRHLWIRNSIVVNWPYHDLSDLSSSAWIPAIHIVAHRPRMLSGTRKHVQSGPAPKYRYCARANIEVRIINIYHISIYPCLNTVLCKVPVQSPGLQAQVIPMCVLKSGDLLWVGISLSPSASRQPRSAIREPPALRVESPGNSW